MQKLSVCLAGDSNFSCSIISECSINYRSLPACLNSHLHLCDSLSFPHLYKKLPRFVRDILRLFMGFLFPFAIYITLAVNIWLGALSLAALFLFWLFYLKLRKKRKLQACDHCDELKAGSICSGFTMQAECSRAYEKQATRIVMNSGYIPGK